MVRVWSDAITLISTGITLGFIHVLTGPDHLSAIATLSANVGNANGVAFWLGVRWGIGHSAGLITVGTVFIVLSLSSKQDEIEIPKNVSLFFECLVGIFMLLLGAYGFGKAWRKRPNRQLKPDDPDVFEDPLSPVFSGDDDEVSRNSVQQRSEMDKIAGAKDGGLNNGDVSESLQDEYEVDDEDDRHSRGLLESWASNVSVRTMALGAGIVHGLAGPGGVLGIIPAVQLRSASLAALYLSTFCISSTLTMGLFAAFYGTCTARIAASHRSSLSVTRVSPETDEDDDHVVLQTHTTSQQKPNHRDFWIECLSACLSIIVGLVWLALLSFGKLDLLKFGK